MMQTYVLFVTLGSLVSLLLMLPRLKHAGLSLAIMPLTALLGGLFGLLGAKLGYVLLKVDAAFGAYGFAAIWHMKSDEFLFTLGAVGVCAGVALAAKLMGVDRFCTLDAFAPCGALLVVVWRYAERWLGLLGAGAYVEDDSFLARWPFGVQNEWEEWYAAVFMLEAVLALIIAVCFFAKRGTGIPGLSFEWCAFWLALTQVICESLRARSVIWGFVRIDQVICGVILLGLVIRNCRLGGRGLPFLKRYGQAFGMVGCIGVVVGVEFLLGKTPQFIRELKTTLDIKIYYYALMLVALTLMALLMRSAVKRRMSRGVSA